MTLRILYLSMKLSDKQRSPVSLIWGEGDLKRQQERTPELEVEFVVQRRKQEEVAEDQGVVAEVGVGHRTPHRSHHLPAEPAGGSGHQTPLRLHIMKPG